jgi:hypothetical protein
MKITKKQISKLSKDDLLLLHDFIAEEFAVRLCGMYGFNRRDCFWVNDATGGVFIINDVEYSISYDDLITLVNKRVDFQVFNDWFSYNKDHTSHIINLNSWLAGLRPKDEEEFEQLFGVQETSDTNFSDGDKEYQSDDKTDTEGLSVVVNPSLSLSKEGIASMFDEWVRAGIVGSASQKNMSSKQIKSEFTKGSCMLTIIEGIIVFASDKETRESICDTINSLVQAHRIGKLLDFQVYHGVKSQYDITKKVKSGQLLRYIGFGGNIVIYIK